MGNTWTTFFLRVVFLCSHPGVFWGMKRTTNHLPIWNSVRMRENRIKKRMPHYTTPSLFYFFGFLRCVLHSKWLIRFIPMIWICRINWIKSDHILLRFFYVYAGFQTYPVCIPLIEALYFWLFHQPGSIYVGHSLTTAISQPISLRSILIAIVVHAEPFLPCVQSVFFSHTFIMTFFGNTSRFFHTHHPQSFGLHW